MNNDIGNEPERKTIPEKRIALIAGLILVGALVLYALNLLLPADETAEQSPTNTPSATPIADSNGTPLPIDCYVPDIKGNSMLFVSADGKSALVDAGFSTDAPAIISRIHGLGLNRLDLVFLTSADDFAIGGMKELLTDIPVGDLWLSAHIVNDSSVAELIEFAKEKQIETHAVNADFVSTVEWADNAELRILSPYNAEYPDTADNALVLRLTYGESAVTVLGSAGALAQRMMVKALPNRLLHADVIFLTDTGRTEQPYEKFFKVSKADFYVLKSYAESANGETALSRFIAGRKWTPIESNGDLHLVLDGVDVKVVE